MDGLVAHPSCHKVKAEAVRLQDRGGIGAAILDYCAEHDPQLLAVGANAYSKFRLDLLGGVTLKVIASCPVPILLSR
ncbi:hypothetical protein DEA8626_03046 [Defluviimonas aquaemixtae]|uniref:UspA domain-containing protein n=1 Tax=Albidovulum aquaemixtae TaxID=1542388 RepID=A0A2R8BKU1_9RHOB|nr:hypothetical protein DEA8626_03046 [Defluviimonas aquaemixtae]